MEIVDFFWKKYVSRLQRSLHQNLRNGHIHDLLLFSDVGDERAFPTSVENLTHRLIELRDTILRHVLNHSSHFHPTPGNRSNCNLSKNRYCIQWSARNHITDPVGNYVWQTIRYCSGKHDISMFHIDDSHSSSITGESYTLQESLKNTSTQDSNVVTLRLIILTRTRKYSILRHFITFLNFITTCDFHNLAHQFLIFGQCFYVQYRERT